MYEEKFVSPFGVDGCSGSSYQRMFEKKFEYTNVIPANASTVVSINMKSLVDKAGLNDKENKEAQQKLTDAMKSGMNAATFQQVEMIMKDPKKSGNRRIGTFIRFQY